MIQVIDEKLLPEHLSFGKKIVKVNKICYLEKMDSKLYKTNLNLGITNVSSITPEGNEFFIPKEEVFRLDSLYRCIIDTGIIIDKWTEYVDYSIESHPKLVTTLGLMALSPVVFNDQGVTKIGVSLVNLSSIHIEITKYMPFAVLVTRDKTLVEMTFQHG